MDENDSVNRGGWRGNPPKQPGGVRFTYHPEGGLETVRVDAGAWTRVITAADMNDPNLSRAVYGLTEAVRWLLEVERTDRCGECGRFLPDADEGDAE